MDNLITYRHVFLILLQYAGLLVSFYGWGHGVSRVLKLDLDSSESHHFPTIWVGWSVVLLILQFTHLFFTLDWRVSASVYFLGSFLSLTAFSRQVIELRKAYKPKIMIHLSVYFFFMLGIAYWLAFKGMGPAQAYDSGLYHFNTIRWINSFPIIPGLGNLHFRLAFNQSFFVYAASLNFYPYFPYSRSVANSFLFLIVYAEMVWQLCLLIRKQISTSNNNIILIISYLSGLLFITYLGLTSDGFTSPISDLASSLIQIILFIWFVQVIINIRNGKSSNDATLALLILAITSVTIKLSNLVFSMVLAVICLIVVYKSDNRMEFANKFIRVIFLWAAIFSIWTIRGIYLSSYPFFPLTLAGLPVDWAVPKDVIQAEVDWIFSWARMPGLNPSEVLGNWNWVYPWLTRLDPWLIWSVISTLFLIIFAVIFAISQKKLSELYQDAVFFIPIVTGLMNWFFTAPDPRFAITLFFLLLLSATLVFTPRFFDFVGSYPGVVIFSGAFIISMFFLVQTNLKSIRSDFSNEYTAIQEVKLIVRETDSGLIVYSPVEGDQCWDSPLPCTPYFNPKLKLRKPTQMEEGFKVNQ